MLLLIAAETMKKFFHLVIPKPALVFDLFLFCKIFYNKNRLIGHFRFFNFEFKEFFFWCMKPMKSYELVLFFFQYFCFLNCTIPCKTENIISIINSIRKPFL